MSEENVLKGELKQGVEWSSLVAILFIGLGLLLLTSKLFTFSLMSYLWPFFIMGIGLLMLAPARKSSPTERNPLSFLVVPGAMVLAQGVLLALMRLLNHYEGMAYAWTLILASGAAGYAYLHRFAENSVAVDRAHRFIHIMIMACLVLGAFLELFVFDILGGWWPLILIGLGVYTLIKSKGRV
jgi:hypothetical protein